MKLLRIYIIGFSLSLLLTGVAFALVGQHIDSGYTTPSRAFLLPVLLLLAIMQLIVQVICFLHLGEEPKPRWKLIVFLYTTLIVSIVVVGSLWIMNHLVHEQISGEEILKDEGVTPHEYDH